MTAPLPWYSQLRVNKDAVLRSSQLRRFQKEAFTAALQLSQQSQRQLGCLSTVAPTGSGKTLCAQLLAAALTAGPVLVITPNTQTLQGTAASWAGNWYNLLEPTGPPPVYVLSAEPLPAPLPPPR